MFSQTIIICNTMTILLTHGAPFDVPVEIQ